MDMCGDNRFEIIARAKKHLLDATNIDTSEDEMKVLDDFLFRCWQMGWLDKYDTGEWIPSDTDGFVCSVCRNGYRNQPTFMGKPMFEYCPVCGAHMKGAGDE